MAWIVIGGLATSTALTLVVVPVFYALIDGASEWTRGLLRRLRGRPAAAAAPLPAPATPEA